MANLCPSLEDRDQWNKKENILEDGQDRAAKVLSLGVSSFYFLLPLFFSSFFLDDGHKTISIHENGTELSESTREIEEQGAEGRKGITSREEGLLY